MDLNAVLSMLKTKMEKKANAIQDLSDEIELKQMEIKETDDAISLLQSFLTQLMNERDEMLDEYDELLNKARKNKVMSFMPSGINKFAFRTEVEQVNIKESEEKAQRIIEKEEALVSSYKLTERINQLRYKVRKTDVEEKEYMDSINELIKLNNLLDQLENE